MATITENDRLLTARELGVKLGAQPATVLIWAAKKIIPSISITPKVVRFDLAEVRKCLAKR